MNRPRRDVESPTVTLETLHHEPVVRKPEACLVLETGAVSAEIELTGRRARRQVKQAWDTESRPKMCQPRYDRATAAGVEAWIVPDAESPGGVEHLMVYAAVRRSEHPPTDAVRHPGVEAGIYGWMLASCCRDLALQSNHS